MMSRAVIEQAKGILMERHKIKEDEAFTILTHACQRTNIELRDMAEARPDRRVARVTRRDLQPSQVGRSPESPDSYHLSAVGLLLLTRLR